MEYRTCTIMETTDDGRTIEYKALFHQWITRSRTHHNKVMDGGFVFQDDNGNDEFLIAVVEYADGTIHKHFSDDIRFTDGLAEKILGNKKDDWNKIEDENIGSYPPVYQNVLVKTSGGKVYRGFRTFSNKWAFDIGDGEITFINNMVAWKELD